MSDIDAARQAGADETLLEREGELDRLGRAISGARAGAGQLVLIEGQAGIGKTALLGRAAAMAAQAGLEVVAARGLELEHEFALGVTRQLVEGVLAHAGAGGRERLLQGPAGLLAPLLADASRGEVPPGELPPLDAAFTLSHGFYWLVANLAELAPVMITLDDAQFADRSSLQCLAYLTGRREELPLLIVLTVRTGDPERDEQLAYLRATPGATIVTPTALSEEAVTSLTQTLLGGRVDDEFAAACARVSGGNPFLLRELLGDLAAERLTPTAANAARIDSVSPEAVRRSVLRRLAGFGEAATELARAVAVLEHTTTVEAGWLAGLELAAAVAATDQLAAAGILVAEPVGFAHPLLRRSVYEQIPPARRGEAHRRAALLLAGRAAPAAAVGAHLLRAAPAADERVIELLRGAAAEALVGGDTGASMALLRRALAEPPARATRALVLGELGRVEALAHDAAATEHLSEALALTEEAEARVAIACALGEMLIWRGGHAGRAYQLLSQVIDELDDDVPVALRAQIETLRTVTASVDSRLASRIWRQLPALRELADRAGAAGRQLKLFEACWGAQTAAARGAWRELLEQALDSGRLVREYTGGAPIVVYATIVLVLADEVEPAQSLLAEIRADARSRGSIISHLVQLAWGAFLSMRCGELPAAASDARVALALARTIDAAGIELWVLVCLAEALRGRGQLAEASQLLKGSAIESGIGTAASLHALLSRARVRLELGQREQAIADLRLTGANVIVDNPSFMPWRSELAGAILDRDREEARALVDAELERALALGQPRGIGVALRARARALDGVAATSALEQSVRVLRDSPAKLELARSLADQGAALRRAGNRRAAREPLREALALARSCGADALAASVREELVIAGARPRREELSGPASLTPSERRVAELVAGGMQNREVAQALFVTTKTIGTHLTHIYQKLDLAGPRARTELAAKISGGVPDAHDLGPGQDPPQAERRT